jgi:hypothetical protein
MAVCVVKCAHDIFEVHAHVAISPPCNIAAGLAQCTDWTHQPRVCSSASVTLLLDKRFTCPSFTHPFTYHSSVHISLTHAHFAHPCTFHSPVHISLTRAHFAHACTFLSPVHISLTRAHFAHSPVHISLTRASDIDRARFSRLRLHRCCFSVCRRGNVACRLCNVARTKVNNVAQICAIVMFSLCYVAFRSGNIQ